MRDRIGHVCKMRVYAPIPVEDVDPIAIEIGRGPPKADIDDDFEASAGEKPAGRHLVEA